MGKTQLPKHHPQLKEKEVGIKSNPILHYSELQKYRIIYLCEVHSTLLSYKMTLLIR